MSHLGQPEETPLLAASVPAVTADSIWNQKRPAILWLCMSMMYFYAAFQRGCVGVITDSLMDAFQTDAGGLGTMNSFFFWAYAAVQIPLGMILDTKSLRPPFLICSALGAAGAFLFASADTYLMGALGRLVVGLGCGGMYLGAVAVVARHFPAKMALLIGFTYACGMIGGLIAQFPMVELTQVVGWRWGVRISALLPLASLPVIWFAGSECKEVPRVATSGGSDGATGQSQWRSVSLVAFNFYNWLISIFAFLEMAAMLSLANLWAVPFLEYGYDFSKETAALAPSAAMLGAALMAPLWGYVADRFKYRIRLMIFFAITGGIITSILAWAHLSLGTLVLCFFVIGCVSVVNIFAAAAKRFNELHVASGAVSVVNTFTTLSGAMFQMIIGRLLDHYWNGAVDDKGNPIYDYDAFQHAFRIFPIAFGGALVTAIIIEIIRWRAKSRPLGIGSTTDPFSPGPIRPVISLTPTDTSASTHAIVLKTAVV